MDASIHCMSFVLTNQNKMNTTIIIRIDAQDKDKAQKAADKSRRSLSDYIRLLLEIAIKENKII